MINLGITLKVGKITNMAKINNNEIPDFQTDWGDDGHGLQYSGARVQEFIKKYLVLGNTANQERWGTALFDVTSYSLIGFKDEDNKAKYLETGDKSLIVGAPVPFSFTGTVNQLKIINNMSSGNLYFTAQAKEAIIEWSLEKFHPLVMLILITRKRYYRQRVVRC